MRRHVTSTVVGDTDGFALKSARGRSRRALRVLGLLYAVEPLASQIRRDIDPAVRRKQWLNAFLTLRIFGVA